MSENIIKVDYKEEMEQSYIDYAMSVIIQRAIPDLRDGLKPVHRRILYAMKQLNLSPDKPYKKSARIVGDVLGKYHPHGDSSVYEAMVRLAQDFNTNYPLVDGQGNFGSIDGDPAAAMRYTEARLEALSFELLQGLDKDIVDFVPNFDNSSQEPEVLPAKFFNLLVNGSTGIAVGMSTNIPPHNLREVNNACKAYLENENISDRGLMRYIKGPDFPTGGTIVNKDELAQIYETGNGRVRVRGKLEVEDLKGGRKNLIVSEIPYSFAGNKTRLIENFIDLVNDKKLDEISDVRDESSKDGIRIVLEVKKGVNIDNLKNKLYQTTRLEDTVSVNMLSIVNNKPAVLSLKEMIKEYTDFLIESYKREFSFDLKNLKADKEIKEGLVEAYNIIDLIIEIIRGSKDRQSVFNCLSQGDVSNIKFKNPESKKAAAKLNFSENQAKAIMKMQLQQLVGLELDKLKEELEIINSKIRELNKLLTDSSSLKDHIIKDLDQMKDKYGVNRRTKISQVEEEDYEEKIIVEDLYALVDRFNYIKVVDEQSYTRANDETLAGFKHIIKLKSNDNICYFADDANFYQIKMEDLPISKMRDRGTPLEEGLEILYIDSRENILSKDELVFATKLGNIKRVETEEFDTIRRELFASKLKDGDKLIFVDLVDEEDKEVVMITKDKRKIRFLLDEVSKQKRNAMGVIGINLNQGDYVKKVKLDKATDKDKRSRGSKGAVIN